MSGKAAPDRRGEFGKGALLTLAASLIWGTQFPVAKAAFAGIDPFHITAVRYVVPTLILVGLLVHREGPSALRFDRHAREATLWGVIGMCGSPALVFGGLMFTRPEIVAVIVATQPAMTALAEWIVRGRKPAPFTLVCLAAAFLGVITVVTRWSLALAPSGLELLGDLMVLGGAVCWVGYTMANERFRGWSTLRLTALTMLPGAIANIAMPFALVGLGVLARPHYAAWLGYWPHLAFLSLAGVLFAMVCWNAGTVRIGPLNAMLFVNLMPVVTFGIGFAQGRRFSTAELAGAAIVIGSLVANNLYLRARRRA